MNINTLAKKLITKYLVRAFLALAAQKITD